MSSVLTHNTIMCRSPPALTSGTWTALGFGGLKAKLFTILLIWHCVALYFWANCFCRMVELWYSALISCAVLKFIYCPRSCGTGTALADTVFLFSFSGSIDFSLTSCRLDSALAASAIILSVCHDIGFRFWQTSTWCWLISIDKHLPQIFAPISLASELLVCIQCRSLETWSPLQNPLT